MLFTDQGKALRRYPKCSERLLKTLCLQSVRKIGFIRIVVSILESKLCEIRYKSGNT